MPADDDIRLIEELLRTLTKGQRALQMYLPNNPVYQRAVEQVEEAFAPVWGAMGRLVLDIKEEEILWEGATVYRQPGRGEGFCWQLYKDGLRQLTLLPGAEAEEVTRLLQVVNRARLLPADSSDDLLTLLWEEQFVLISYLFVEALGDGTEFFQHSPQVEEVAEAASPKDEVERTRATPGRPGLVDLAEFDATPYFLDEAETRLIRSDLEEEYRRDIRRSAVDALLDILETQRSTDVRREIVGLLETLLPVQLAAGGFKAVAHILRELRVIAARAHGLDEELHRAVLSFEDRLSEPEILEQFFRVIENPEARPADEDVAEVLRELKPKALPPILAHLGQSLDTNIRRVLEPSIDGLARGQPQLLVDVIEQGPEEALPPAIGAVARLNLTQLVPQLSGLLKHARPDVRSAAVRALGELGTPTAVGALSQALDDEERSVRQAALAILVSRGGSGALQKQLEAMLFDGEERDWDRTERRAFFEAYGQFTGAPGIPRLESLLEPRGLFRRKVSPEVRACALFALGKIRTFDARLIVDRHSADKEPVVRSAANSLLRDWMP